MKMIYIILLLMIGTLLSSVSYAGKILECVDKKIAKMEFKEKFVVEGRARVEGPGYRGGRRTAEDKICFKAAPGYSIKGNVNAIKTGDNGRYHINPVKYDKDEVGNVTSACVSFKAWSESQSFGAGGWVDVELRGVSTVAPTVVDRERLTIKCEEEIYGN